MMRLSGEVMLTGEASTEAALPRARRTDEKVTMLDVFDRISVSGDAQREDVDRPYIRPRDKSLILMLPFTEPLSCKRGLPPGPEEAHGLENPQGHGQI